MPDGQTDGRSSQESVGVHELLGVEFVEVTRDCVVLSLAVGPQVHQPYGLLHGGVSALLAESAASIGSGLNVAEGKAVVGIELSASHLRGMSEGTLTATARPIRLGRAVHVWHIELTNEVGALICDAKCTVAVIDRPGS